MSAYPLKQWLLAVCLGGAVASALAHESEDSRILMPVEGSAAVTVAWDDPMRFSDVRFSGNRGEAIRGDWARQIARYMQTRAAKQFHNGERLDIQITDIQRAGGYETTRDPSASDIRVVRDLYPPRISLTFVLRDAAGAILARGERQLTDMNFLHSSIGTVGSRDPLRYEKRLINEWVRSEFER